MISSSLTTTIGFNKVDVVVGDDGDPWKTTNYGCDDALKCSHDHI